MEHNYNNQCENVVIRPLGAGDLEYLRVWRNDSANTKYLRKIPYITYEMQKNWFNNYLRDETVMVFAIEEVEHVCGLVGSMALYNFEAKQAEFGRLLIGDNNAHGLRVGLNALKALKKIAQNDLNLQKIYLHVYKDNLPALKVYKEAGFSITSQYVSDNKLTEYIMSIKL